MAALNFPLSPNDGDVYGNYVYDATEGVWNANPLQLASRFITSATQPTSPSNGDGWLDTNTGKTYIYYNDGSSAQWIESGNPVIGFVDPYDQTTTSTGHFALPKGTSAQRPVAPQNGDIRFNTELSEPEWYSATESRWVLFRQSPTLDIDYLVIAGGGAGGTMSSGAGGGGGGAGGYRCSMSGESSGGGLSAESRLSLSVGVAYSVTVGAGGAATTSGGVAGGDGASSILGSITTVGGGGGSSFSSGTADSNGGSGGGGNRDTPTGGAGTTGQGFKGGDGNASTTGGAGGGGAGQVGNNQAGSIGGNGGNGVASSITGSSVTRAGGGGGASRDSAFSTGGTGGGGAGGLDNTAGVAGTTNTGSGGGGGEVAIAGNGGSGIVFIKYPSAFTATHSVGLTSITSTLGDYKVTQFTAGTGTVTFS